METLKAKIIVCGGRHFNNYDYLKFVLNSILSDNGLDYEEVEIVSGHCAGADKLGEKYAEEHNVKCKIFPAEWEKYGRSAGPIRNQQMIDYLSNCIKPMVVAFVSENSRGTKDTLKRADKNNYELFVFEY